MSINIIAILSPAAGKTDRLVELLNQVSDYIQTGEPGTLKYEVYQQVNSKSGADEVIVVECYQDKAALAEHGKSAAFINFQKKAKEEGLMAGPLQLKFVKPAGGFASRL